MDYIQAYQRLNPPKTFRQRLRGLWVKYHLRNAHYELSWARAAEIEARWRGEVMKLKDKLKELGYGDIDPEDITHSFEMWLVVGLVITASLAVLAFNAYRSALINLIGG